jgi:hypothetical protein
MYPKGFRSSVSTLNKSNYPKAVSLITEKCQITFRLTVYEKNPDHTPNLLLLQSSHYGANRTPGGVANLLPQRLCTFQRAKGHDKASGTLFAELVVVALAEP